MVLNTNPELILSCGNKELEGAQQELSAATPAKEIQWTLLQFGVPPQQTVVSTAPFISSIFFISFIFFISLFVAFASFSTLEYTKAKTFGLDLIFEASIIRCGGLEYIFDSEISADVLASKLEP